MAFYDVVLSCHVVGVIGKLVLNAVVEGEGFRSKKATTLSLSLIGSIVVPFWGSYLELYKVFPKRNYYGAYGYSTVSLQPRV